MQVKTVALLTNFALGAYGVSECPAGKTIKKDLTNLFCTSSAEDAASCGATCCENDKLTCGGIGVNCNYGTYAEGTDAWKATATTKKTFQQDCCKPVATCANTLFECPAGKKRSTGAGVQAIKCPGGPSSCVNVAQCCSGTDTTVCGGVTGVAATCDANTVKGSDDAWKKIRVATIFKTDCCGAKAVCSTVKCPVGHKAKTGVANTACAGTTCDVKATSGTDYSTCCTADASVCAGATPACAASQYYPSKRPEWQARKQTNGCCTAKATCAVAKCKSGYKLKANVEMLSCTGDKDSCAEGSICCQLDVTKCGGLAGITCPYGTYDESTRWTSDTTQATKDAWNNKAATAATKNTDCCTAEAACSTDVTTTPAAVVTTTPVAPARLFSEHKHAITKTSGGSKASFVLVGAFTGMAVMFMVQKLRQKSEDRVQAESREVDGLLAPTLE